MIRKELTDQIFVWSGMTLFLAFIAAFFIRYRNQIAEVPLVGQMSEFIQGAGSAPNIVMGDIAVPGIDFAGRSPINITPDTQRDVFNYGGKDEKCGCGGNAEPQYVSPPPPVQKAAQGLAVSLPPRPVFTPAPPPVDPATKYFRDNPDVAAAWRANSHNAQKIFKGNVSDFVRFHWNTYGSKEGRINPYI